MTAPPVVPIPMLTPPAPAGGAPHSPVLLESVRPVLRGLNREQRQAVTHGEGPLLVIAGPGTGKTEVITRRVAWLIAAKRARPSEILALTFTEKAADEMQGRVDQLVPYGQADTAIHTFHAFGDRLIREFAFELGLAGEPRVISRAEAVVLLREHLFELGLHRFRPLSDPTRFLDALVGLISRAKDEGVGPDSLVAYAAELQAGAEVVRDGSTDAAEREIAASLLEEAAQAGELGTAYARYQELLLERGLVDFGDQVSLAVRLLEEHPTVRQALQRRYRYILVDEFQDTDPVQLTLVRSLAGETGNVTVVGDDDQAIYAFRGAAVQNVIGMQQAYPVLRRVVLRRNYRSRAPILAAARSLIGHNDLIRLEGRDGLDKTLVPHRRSRRAAPVRHVSYRTVAEEADGTVGMIAERIARGARAADFAVLVRTNAGADPFLRALSVAGIPWRFSGASGLYARREIRDLLAFLRVVADPGSTLDLYAVATGEPYGLGGEDLSALLGSARRRHRSLWEICTELLEQPGLLRSSGQTRQALERLVGDIRDAIEQSHLRPAGEVLYAHLKRSGRLASLVAAAERGDDGQLRDVARFFEVIRDQGRLLTEDRIPFLVPHLRVLVESGDDATADDDDTAGSFDAVSVLTVHKAKGLEFPVVFLVGMADGRFPARSRRDRLRLPDALLTRATGSEDQVPWAEERRLCYVGMTRARDELILSHAAESATGRRRRPSVFVAEALDRPGEAVRPDHVPDPSVAGVLDDLTAAFGAEPPPSPATVAGRRAGTLDVLSLSYSQVDDYLACPLRYRLRHMVGVPTPAHHALGFGNALHQAVAAFGAARIRGQVMDEPTLMAAFAAHWSSEGFISREHEEARFAAGKAALVRFRDAQMQDEMRVPLAVERPFAVRLGPDTIRGRYDRLDSTPQGIVITDFKSSDVRDPARAAQKARDSLQLRLYALAHQAETGDLPAAVELHFLEGGTVGRVVPDESRLAAARAAVAETADGIRAARFAARPEYMTCNMCPFREICPESAA